MSWKKMKSFDPNNWDPKTDIKNLCFSEEFVDSLITLISERIEPPFSLSIDGEWGTGKTHLMKILEKRLRQDNYPTLWFNPWKYSKSEDVYFAFLKRLSNNFKNQHAIKDLGVFAALLVVGSIDTAARLISRNSLSYSNMKEISKDFRSVTGRRIDKYEDLSEELENNFRDITNRIFKKCNDKPLIIFFDDLDRCLPREALILLEAMKNSFNVKDAKAVFVFGLNSRITKNFIKHIYPDIDESYASLYFKKIFDYTIKIPVKTNEMVRCFIENRVEVLFGGKHEEVVAEILDLNRIIRGTSLRILEKIIYGFFVYSAMNRNDQLPVNFVLLLLFIKEVYPVYYSSLIDSARMRRFEDKCCDALFSDFSKQKGMDGALWCLLVENLKEYHTIPIKKLMESCLA